MRPRETTMEGIEYVPASEIKVGDQLVEREGTYFEVSAIRHERGGFVFSLKNTAGYMGGSPTQTPRFRPSTKLRRTAK